MVKRSSYFLFLLLGILVSHSSAPAFSQNRVLEWARELPLDWQLRAEGLAVSIAADGSIIVGGPVANSAAQSEYVASKFTRAGERVWMTRHQSERNDTNGSSLAVDEKGNVILTGSSGTLKFDASGNLIWASDIGGESVASNADYAYVTGAIESGHRIVQLGNQSRHPVDVILDCDPGHDVDDLSDIAIANKLMSRGEINVIAMMGAHRARFIAESIQIMNRYYGHRDIKVATAMDGPQFEDGYSLQIVLNYGPTIGYDLPVPDAKREYRRVLSSRPDKSLTIIFTGQLRNLLSLWNSGPDEYSRLFGPALIEKKVKEIVVVAGFFPTSGLHGEHNLATDPEAALVLNKMTNSTPIKFVGIELGDTIKIPANGIAQMKAGNPVRFIHELLRMQRRESWSGPALLNVARGSSWRGNNYFTSVRGRVEVRTNGANAFVEDPSANQEYLRKTQSDTRFAEMLDDLLLPEPSPSPSAAEPPDRSGQAIWTETISQTSLLRESPKIAQLDSFGDLIVGGIGEGQPSRGCFTLRQYGEAGRLRWIARTTNAFEPDRQQMRLQAMAVTNGNIWLFGQYGPSASVFKFGADGQQQWSYSDPGVGTASTMLVDSLGQTHFVQVSSNSVTVNRITADGKLSGSAVFSDPQSATISIQSMAKDGKGDLYLAGSRTDHSDRSEIILIGVHAGLSRFSGLTHRNETGGEARASAMAIDSSGDIYVVGTLANNSGGADLAALKYTSDFKVEKIAGGAFKVRSLNPPDRLITLEASTNLVTWRPILIDRSDSSGFVTFEDATAATLPSRFYRLLIGPKE